MMDASLAGKPAWAMKSRVLALSFSQAQGRISEYLTAFEQSDPNQRAEAAANATAELRRVRGYAAELPIAGAGECVQALSAIEAAITAGAVPSAMDLELVEQFVESSYC